MLHFCLASVGDWRWSEPIDINQLGIFPRKIDHSGYSSQLFVEVKRIGGLQKQVTSTYIECCFFIVLYSSRFLSIYTEGLKPKRFYFCPPSNMFFITLLLLCFLWRLFLTSLDVLFHRFYLAIYFLL